MRRMLFVTALALFAIPAHADELADMKAALETATRSIQALQKRVQALEAEKAAKDQADVTGSAPARRKPAPVVVKTAPPPVPLVPTALLEAAPVVAPNEKPEKPLTYKIGDKGARLEISGAVQLDAIYDFKKVDPNWEGTLRPSKIPVVCPPLGTDPGCGRNEVTNFNVRATNLDIRGFLPTEWGEIKTRFAFDLWGGADVNEVRFRLTQAWGSYGPFLFGYTDSVFMDGDVFPTVLDFWGPSGMIFVRDPQIRWTPLDWAGMKLALALEVPSAAIDEGHVTGFFSRLQEQNLIDPNLGLGILPKAHVPDITGHFRVEGPWGHLQLAGVARWVSFDNPLGREGLPFGTVFGWGANLTGKIKTFGDDALMGQVAYGKPIAAYINDCCFDLAPAGIGHAVSLPLWGWFVYYDHWWSKQWSSSIGYSEDQQGNTAGQLDFAQHIGRYASANLLFYPFQNVMLGLEGLWGERVNKNGDKNQDQRIQFSSRVKF